MIASWTKQFNNKSMECLELYQALCESAQDLISKENAVLKQGQMPSRDLLEAKSNLIPQLDSALQALKSTEKLSSADKKIAQKIQQKLMKILLQDKENEKLLLALQVPQQFKSMPSVASSHLLKTTYGKNH